VGKRKRTAVSIPLPYLNEPRGWETTPAPMLALKEVGKRKGMVSPDSI
jgi:hypothetical protein